LLFDSVMSPSLYWGVRTHTVSTLLSFSGQPVLGYRVIWLLAIHTLPQYLYSLKVLKESLIEPLMNGNF